MITHRHITNSKILETVTGFILFAAATAMRLAPLAIRDESGESYIVTAFLILLGCWALFDSLFK